MSAAGMEAARTARGVVPNVCNMDEAALASAGGAAGGGACGVAAAAEREARLFLQVGALSLGRQQRALAVEAVGIAAERAADALRAVAGDDDRDRVLRRTRCRRRGPRRGGRRARRVRCRCGSRRAGWCAAPARSPPGTRCRGRRAAGRGRGRGIRRRRRRCAARSRERCVAGFDRRRWGSARRSSSASSSNDTRHRPLSVAATSSGAEARVGDRPADRDAFAAARPGAGRHAEPLGVGFVEAAGGGIAGVVDRVGHGRSPPISASAARRAAQRRGHRRRG